MSENAMGFEVKQIRNGMQPRPYADHVWEWDITTDKPYEEVLEFCKANLKKAEREKKEYWKEIRSNLGFEKHMEVVCGGYYTLTKIEGGYKYKVTRDYID